MKTMRRLKKCCSRANPPTLNEELQKTFSLDRVTSSNRANAGNIFFSNLDLFLENEYCGKNTGEKLRRSGNQ